MAKKEKSTVVSKEISDLGKILSGEMALKEKEEEILKLKKKAIEEQKKKIRDGLKSGEVKVKDLKKNKKVVQKIKLFEWESPVRVPFNFEMKNFLVVVAFCLLFILFLAILGHYVLMFAIISLLFLIYVSGTTKPVDVKHTITARGIESLDVLYEWYVLENFFFTEKKGHHLLIVETSLRLPAKLLMLVDKKDIETIFLLLQDQLLYKDVKKQSSWEKMNFGEYIPLEKI
jgi:hypothetical protein